MIGFVRLLLVEIMKMRRSKVFWQMLSIPAVVVWILWTVAGNVDERLTWQLVELGVVRAWAAFFLPMSIILTAALAGQIEHRHNTWSYMLSLPQAKWQVFLAKGITVALFIAAITATVYGAALGAGELIERMRPDRSFLGTPPYEHFARDMMRTWIAGLLMIAVQFGISVWVGGIVLPILIGIGGTFFAIFAGASALVGVSFDSGTFLPWMIPSNLLAGDPERTMQALLVGGAGGSVALVAVSLVLARRDWT